MNPVAEATANVELGAEDEAERALVGGGRTQH